MYQTYVNQISLAFELSKIHCTDIIMQEVLGLFFKECQTYYLKIWTAHLLVHKSAILVSGYKWKAHVNKANIVLLNVLIFKTTFIKNKKS